MLQKLVHDLECTVILDALPHVSDIVSETATQTPKCIALLNSSPVLLSAVQNRKNTDPPNQPEPFSACYRPSDARRTCRPGHGIAAKTCPKTPLASSSKSRLNSKMRSPRRAVCLSTRKRCSSVSRSRCLSRLHSSQCLCPRDPTCPATPAVSASHARDSA
eukprot:3134558-Rhodomonas_salina.2